MYVFFVQIGFVVMACSRSNLIFIILVEIFMRERVWVRIDVMSYHYRSPCRCKKFKTFDTDIFVERRKFLTLKSVFLYLVFFV